jgi:hypothetical protein
VIPKLKHVGLIEKKRAISIDYRVADVLTATE